MENIGPLNLSRHEIETIGLLNNSESHGYYPSVGHSSRYDSIPIPQNGIQTPYDKRGFASIGASMINLSNTMLGAGVLAIPYAMANCGVYIGLLLFVVCGLLSYIGLYFVSHAAREIENADYKKLSERTMSSIWITRLVDLAVAIKCFGVGTSYLIIIGDLMPQVISYFINENYQYYGVLTDRRLSIAIFSILFVFPTILLKKLNGLRYVSLVCLLTMVYVGIVTILYAFWPSVFAIDSDSTDTTTMEWFPSDTGKLLSVLSIFIFAFTCHQNAFSITNELKNPTNVRLNSSLILAVSLCLIFYLIVALCVCYTFGSSVESDMLVNYPNGSIVTLVLKFLLSVNIAFSFALQCNPCRMSLSQLLFGKSIVEIENNFWLFYGMTISIALVSFVIAMVVSDLGTVLAIIGATGSTTIAYILPGWFYFQMFRNDKSKVGRKWGAFALLLLGCCVVPFSLTVVFLNYF